MKLVIMTAMMMVMMAKPDGADENDNDDDDLYRGRQHEQLDGDWAKWRKCVRPLAL